MPYRPPKGVRPPQLEGKRTGRPKGSKNFASAWRDCLWGYEHRDDASEPPSQWARVWRDFAHCFPDEVRAWLEKRKELPREREPGVRGLLEDMRWVINHRKEADMTQGQRTCRRWMEESFKPFMSRYTQLERAHGRRW